MGLIQKQNAVIAERKQELMKKSEAILAEQKDITDMQTKVADRRNKVKAAEAELLALIAKLKLPATTPNEKKALALKGKEMQADLKKSLEDLQPYEIVFKDTIAKHNKKRKDLHNEMAKVDGEVSHVSDRTDNVNTHVKTINAKIIKL